jgi:hypothetical protein
MLLIIYSLLRDSPVEISPQCVPMRLASRKEVIHIKFDQFSLRTLGKILITFGHFIESGLNQSHGYLGEPGSQIRMHLPSKEESAEHSGACRLFRLRGKTEIERPELVSSGPVCLMETIDKESGADRQK